MSPSKRIEVDAFARVLTVPARPYVRHGRAVKDTDECECNPIRNDNAHQDVDGSSKLPLRKNPEAEAKKGQFDQRNGQDVEDLANPQNLHHVSDESITRS
jgi:hypothetical protein